MSANSKYWPAVPWAVPRRSHIGSFGDMDGAKPLDRSEARRTSCRANRLSDDVWAAALVAGGLGLVALMLFLNVMNRMVHLPAQATGDLSHVPFVTLLFWLLMGSIVAGVAEESAFRGYMQGPIERRHGPVIAILLTGSLFGFAHFTHPEVTLVLMPYYLGAAAVYGALAYITISILPSLVLHAGGNVLNRIGAVCGGAVRGGNVGAGAIDLEAGTTCRSGVLLRAPR